MTPMYWQRKNVLYNTARLLPIMAKPTTLKNGNICLFQQTRYRVIQVLCIWLIDIAISFYLIPALCDVIGTIEGLASSKDLQGYFSGALGSIAGDTTKNLIGVDFNEVYKHVKIIRGDDTYVPSFSEGFKTAI